MVRLRASHPQFLIKAGFWLLGNATSLVFDVDIGWYQANPKESLQASEAVLYAAQRLRRSERETARFSLKFYRE